MSDDERRALNIDALRSYLAAAFPEQSVVEFSPTKHGGVGFRVDGARTHVAVVADEFLDDLALMRQKLSRSRGRWQCG